MRNFKDEDDDFNYGPNDLAELERRDPVKYRSIVEQNIDEDDTVEKWQQRNLERAKQDLAWQQRKFT